MMVQLIPVIQSHDYKKALHNIYLDSFPADERRDWDQLLELTKLPYFTLYGIHMDNEPIGLITVWRWPELTFIEHFAIAGLYQGKGIGTEVIKQLIQTTNTKIVLETEEPLSEFAMRRIAFYIRLGFHICQEEYYQPAYAQNKKPVKMMLMSYPQQITFNEFNTIRALLNKNVYLKNII